MNDQMNDEMKDENKTKEQLIGELKSLRKQVARLERKTDRIHSKGRELGDSNALLKSIFQSTREVNIFSIDPDYCYLFFNNAHKQAMKSIWGGNIGVGRNMPAYFTNEADQITIKKKFDRVLAGESFITMERVGENKQIFYESAYNPIYDMEEKIIGLTVFSTDITSSVKVRTELEEVRVELTRTFDLTPDMICVAGQDGYFKRLNPAWTTVLGYSIVELLSAPLMDFIHPDDRESTLREITKQSNGNNTDYFENRYRHKDGSYRVLAWQATPVDEKGLLHAAARDITQQKIAEEKIKESLHEKEVLLKEIHHRVKNNLAVISSLLNLQAEKFLDKEVKGAFKDSQMRIRSMALVHEHLYQASDLSNIDFAHYIRSLVNQISRSSFLPAHSIPIEVNAMDVNVDINLAIPCALIINELVTNAVKYAFPEDRSGSIEVQFLLGDHMFTLSVSDNGVGLPKDFNIETSSSFGMELIRMLSHQLEASLVIESEAGTRVTLTFPEE